MLSNHEFVGLHSQMNEIMKRVGNDSLNPASVRRALQDIIEGKSPTYAWSPPMWWCDTEQQLFKARQLWPELNFPEPPTNFVPQSKTEVLLLHVPHSFDKLWANVRAPVGYEKLRTDDFRTDKKHLRLAPDAREYKEPVWLAFDPEHGNGIHPYFFWLNSPELGPGLSLAASEVLSALIQFPDWPRKWHYGASAPNLAGYQIKHGDWSGVPCLVRWGGGRCLELGIRSADTSAPDWSSPSVREC